jgi:hypothetical protein
VGKYSGIITNNQHTVKRKTKVKNNVDIKICKIDKKTKKFHKTSSIIEKDSIQCARAED